jgi:hypothetical protein
LASSKAGQPVMCQQRLDQVYALTMQPRLFFQNFAGSAKVGFFHTEL